MKVFLSWSGAKSRMLAIALNGWLPDLLQDLEPFISENDISAGSRWALELSKSLEATDVGIICLTVENLASPWLLFEAGSLSKRLDNSRVIPYVLDIKSAEVPYPLAQFQSVDVTREGTLKLVKALNALRASPMENNRLERVFSRLWGDLEQGIVKAKQAKTATLPVRPDRELLEEILNLVRSQQEIETINRRSFTEYGFEHIGDFSANRQPVEVVVYWHDNGFTRDEALEFCGMLENQKIPCKLKRHADNSAPDALFIGALVEASIVRIVLKAIPYKVLYLFRPDYPEKEGGSSSGLKVGVGYRSTHMAGRRGYRSEPCSVTEDDIDRLKELGLSNIEFHRRLRKITGAE